MNESSVGLPMMDHEILARHRVQPFLTERAPWRAMNDTMVVRFLMRFQVIWPPAARILAGMMNLFALSAPERKLAEEEKEGGAVQGHSNAAKANLPVTAGFTDRSLPNPTAIGINLRAFPPDLKIAFVEIEVPITPLSHSSLSFGWGTP